MTKLTNQLKIQPYDVKILRLFFILPITNIKKNSRFKHKKKHIPQMWKESNFHVKKKEKHYSTCVQLNNENQYWHENLLLFEDDEKIFIDNTSWLWSQHMDSAMKILYETKL
jgi:hypothetical protein